MAEPTESKRTKLFNDEHFAPSKSRHAHEFHRFSRLPLELRLRIWTFSLMQHRFIPIYSVKIGVEGVNIDHVPLYSSQNDLGNTISGSPYKLSVNASVADAASPLLSTTVESRLAAMEFFRIRLPLIQGHIRICPEYDVLYVKDWDRAPFIFADVLHDIRAYDPKDEGLMHLALDHSHHRTFFGVAQPSDLLSGRHLRPNDDMPHFDFGTFLSDHDMAQLHSNIIGVNNVTTVLDDVSDDGGRTAGPDGQDVHHAVATASLVDILSNKLRSLWCIESLNCSWWNRSPPRPGLAHRTNICPLVLPSRHLCRSSVNFDWLESDPRLMPSDISQLPFTHDPRRFYHSWQNLEKSLGVRHNAPFRFLVCVADWMPSYSGQEGVREITERYRHWEMLELQKTNELKFRCPDPNVPIPKHDCTGNTAATIGMWIYPGEAFGQISEVDRWRNGLSTVSELPGLAVFDV